MRPFFCLLFLLFASEAISEEAEELDELIAEPPSLSQTLVGFGFSGDSANSSFTFNGQVALGGHFEVFADHTRNSGDANSSANATSIGGHFIFNPNWSLRAFYDRWGQTGSLISRGGNGSLNWAGRHLALGISGGFKQISAEFQNATRTNDFDYIGGSLSVFLGRYALTFSHTEYYYETDMSVLNTDTAQASLPLSILSLGSSFLDRQTSLALGFQKDVYWLDLEFVRAIGAVDKLTAKSFQLILGGNVSLNWDVETHLGHTTIGADQSSLFGGMSFTYYWSTN